MANLEAHDICAVCQNFSREHVLSHSGLQAIASNEEFRALEIKWAIAKEIRRWLTNERAIERASARRRFISEPSVDIDPIAYIPGHNFHSTSARRIAL